MSSQFNKWVRNKQDINAPLHVVLFTSRNKDNKEEVKVNGFHERRKAFLYHLENPCKPTYDLTESFYSFVEQGCQNELSRMYISCNARDPVKIKRTLMHRLIDDQLGGSDPLTHMDSVVASIAAKKECSAERKWFFDFDDKDSTKVQHFSNEIITITDHNVEPEVLNTPHGFAVICSHGFDIRKLSDTYQQMMHDGLLTLKRDDLLCVDWQVNRTGLGLHLQVDYTKFC